MRQGNRLDPRESTEYLGISSEAIYKACQLGGLKYTRVHGRRQIRTKKEWPDDWMESNAKTITVAS